MKLSVKMLGGFLILAVLAAAVGLTGVFSIQMINQRGQATYDDSTQGIIHLQEMESSYLQIRVLIYRTMALQDDKLTKQVRANAAEIIKAWNEAREKYAKTVNDGEERKVFEAYDQARNDYFGVVELTLGYVEKGDFSQAIEYLTTKGSAVVQTMVANSKKLMEFNVNSARKNQDASQDEGRFSVTIMIGLTAAAFLAALLLGLGLTRTVTRAVGGEPAQIAAVVDQIAQGKLYVNWGKGSSRATGIRKSMESMTEALQLKAAQIERIASGDLRADIKMVTPDDNLAASMKKLSEALNQTIRDITNRMEQALEGASQVASASQSLSQSSTEQAAGLEEITSTVTELSSQTQKNAADAQSASQLAQEALKSAEAGNSQMKELVSAMDAINASSEDIKKVVKVIDDIAFQINLLALNANVEAARAGKYGRGFAVVADEVRNLAVKSSQAVKETTDMVNDSIANITNGSGLVRKTAVQLEQIAQVASKVTDIVGEIASASGEQATGLSQINQALSQIDGATQANTATSEETASAAQELNSQAQNVQKLLLSFQLKG